MSFAQYKNMVEDGDLVILFLGYNYMLPLTVSTGETYQTKFGALRHNDIIGKRYGSKVKTAKGYLYALHPDCELWTNVLPHRTQILYPVDISMVISQLELKPGSVVVESGTGSASLSHALIRTVAPSGHLHTFDFHEERLLKAKEEFRIHGIDSWVTPKHRDVLSSGFDLENAADAVFLDIPAPWDAIIHAKRALKKDRVTRICSFSPCMEQVQAACESLKKFGFTDVVTYECLAKNLDVVTVNLPKADLGWEDDEDEYYDFIAKESWNQCSIRPPEGDGVDEIPSTEDSNSKPASATIPFNADKRKTAHFSCKSTNPPVSTPGHTGFLTFATLFPTL